MNILDIIFAIVVGFFLLRGAFRGLIVELASMAGAIAGFFLANTYHTALIPSVQKILATPSWAATISYMAVFFATIVMATLLAAIVSKALPPIVSGLNTLTGCILGLVKGALVCLVAFMVLTSYMPDASFVVESKAAPYMAKAADYLRRYMPEKVGMVRLSSARATAEDA